ncbi:unnamed protein product [Cuscuta campestris]|uniref:26S proteasome regulatory subunit RPN7 n=1 Tax=Cuscuta campestris TaxID=132261 RepID=A0A484L4L5_9ASTE|nr:unnamed protein product [Cuscuta campestris]
MEGEGVQTQHLILAKNISLLTNSDVDDLQKVRLRDEVYNVVVSNDMAPLYQTLVSKCVLTLDPKVLNSMRDRIDEELKKLDEKIADAEENLGESEVREAHLAKSLFYIRIGDKDKALEQLKVTESKTVAVGQKMDLGFYTLQMGFFDMDFDLISKSIDRAKNLFEEGGDWERKNRLKVYEGLFCMSTRNFKKAANLFLDSISTFTTYELFPYDTFIFYTVLTSIITLDRVSLKQKVVDAPEILTVIGKIPYLSEFLNSLYDCQYKEFFSAFWLVLGRFELRRATVGVSGKGLKVLLWTIWHEMVMGNAEQRKRSLTRDSSCPFCSGHEETISHIFRACRKARQIWNIVDDKRQKIRRWIGHTEMRRWIGDSLKRQKNRHTENNWAATFAITCWWIWR